MKNKCVKLTVITVITLLYFFIESKTNPEQDAHLKINNNIQNSINKKSEIKLTEITPFEWEKAILVNYPYSSKKDISQLINIDNIDDVQMLIHDTERRVIFIKDNKMVFDYHYSVLNKEFKSSNLIIDNKSILKIYYEKDNPKKIILENLN